MTSPVAGRCPSSLLHEACATAFRSADCLFPGAAGAGYAWNEYVITLKNDVLELVVNGVKVNHAHGLTVVPGAVGLQSEGGPIHFRIVKLTPLR